MINFAHLRIIMVYALPTIQWQIGKCSRGLLQWPRGSLAALLPVWKISIISDVLRKPKIFSNFHYTRFTPSFNCYHLVFMRREDSLEKTLMLGKCEGKRRRGRQRTRWFDSVTEATNVNLTQLREAVEDRRAWRALVHGVTKSRTRLND